MLTAWSASHADVNEFLKLLSEYIKAVPASIALTDEADAREQAAEFVADLTDSTRVLKSAARHGLYLACVKKGKSDASFGCSPALHEFSHSKKRKKDAAGMPSDEFDMDSGTDAE